MKEFIDKLIERLEGREKYYHECALDEIMENGHTLDAEGFLGKEDAYGDAISIVNHIAEEYINCSTDISTKSNDCSTDNQKLECRCKDCIHWYDMVAGATEHVKLCAVGGYMVGQNGYCVYGEKRLPAPYTEGE